MKLLGTKWITSIDDIGFGGFSEGFMDWYVDADTVADDFEEYFWDDIE